MLEALQKISEKFLSLLQQDPVRPHIPVAERVGDNKDIFVLREGDDVKAITCVSYQEDVPIHESDLFGPSGSEPGVAVFYTIWSYSPGSGRDLLLSAVKHIKANRPEVNRFVTLSPKTEMAKKFHLKNGAWTFRENPDTINYEYDAKNMPH